MIERRLAKFFRQEGLTGGLSPPALRAPLQGVTQSLTGFVSNKVLTQLQPQHTKKTPTRGGSFFSMAHPEGFEPTTFGSVDQRSIH